MVSRERADKIARVCARRTRHVVIVLEDIVDVGNENAVLRSADALGFQVIHTICNNDLNDGSKMRKSKKTRSNRLLVRTDVGCRQWLDVVEWGSSAECISHLRADKYLIALADPQAQSDICALPLDDKVAVVFGNESTGLSETMHASANLAFCLPMFGFVNSFNVSVAAAISMYDIHKRLQVRYCCLLTKI